MLVITTVLATGAGLVVLLRQVCFPSSLKQTVAIFEGLPRFVLLIGACHLVLTSASELLQLSLVYCDVVSSLGCCFACLFVELSIY